MKKCVMITLVFAISISLSAQKMKRYKGHDAGQKTEVQKTEDQEEKSDIDKGYNMSLRIYKPNMSAAPVEYWSSPYNYNFFNSTGNEYDTYQYKNQISYQFTNVINLSLVCSKSKTLNTTWGLQYGMGFNYFTFQYDQISNKVEELVINHYVVIEPGTHTPETVIITPINSPHPNDTYNYSTDIDNLKSEAISLMLPVSVNYKLGSHWTAQGSLIPNIPFYTRESGIQYSYTSGFRVAVSQESTKINRFLLDSGLGIHYHFNTGFSIGASYHYLINSLLGSKEDDNYYKIGTVKMSSFGINFGMNF